MKLLILTLVSVFALLTSCQSGEKCRIELSSRLELTNVECNAILGDSLQVVSQNFTGWVQLSTINVVYLDRPSRIVTGAGIGLVGGLVAGYLIGNISDNNGAGSSVHSDNNRFTYGLAGAGIGLVVGCIVGAIVEDQTEFHFNRMSDAGKRELFQGLILSTGA